jgi:putative methyltransferase (TIGR04325 family)
VFAAFSGTKDQAQSQKGVFRAIMKRRIKNIIRGAVPPVVLDVYRLLFFHMAGFLGNDFFGNYKTWEEACKASGGYDSDIILNKVKDALLKVKNSQAVYERDSVLFDKVQYSWPLLAGLLWIASRNENRLSVIDFGGSLGSTYFQNRTLLSHLRELNWSIIEQEKFVDCGKRYFEDKHLAFYYGIDECLKERRSDTILLSSVIQYIEKPYDLLREIISKRFTYVLFDRTAFSLKAKDRITVQKVPPSVYEASYPCWFLNEKKFLDLFSANYRLIADFESLDRANVPSVFKGYIFMLKNAD